VLFGAAASFKAQKLGLQVATLDADRGPGGRDQGGFEPRCPFAGASRAPFAGALVISGAHCRPGQQVPGSGKARHVDADLRHQDVRGELTTPGIVVSRRAHSSIGAKVFSTSASTVVGARR
jgi:hypothetical protein